MPTTINVTQEDIKLGERKTCRSCPVALAIQRQVRTFNQTSVTYTHIFFGYDLNGQAWEIATPYEVANFLFDFDNGIAVEPFSFTLNVPPDLTRLSDS